LNSVDGLIRNIPLTLESTSAAAESKAGSDGPASDPGASEAFGDLLSDLTKREASSGESSLQSRLRAPTLPGLLRESFLFGVEPMAAREDGAGAATEAIGVNAGVWGGSEPAQERPLLDLGTDRGGGAEVAPNASRDAKKSRSLNRDGEAESPTAPKSGFADGGETSNVVPLLSPESQLASLCDPIDSVARAADIGSAAPPRAAPLVNVPMGKAGAPSAGLGGKSASHPFAPASPSASGAPLQLAAEAGLRAPRAAASHEGTGLPTAATADAPRPVSKSKDIADQAFAAAHFATQMSFSASNAPLQRAPAESDQRPAQATARDKETGVSEATAVSLDAARLISASPERSSGTAPPLASALSKADERSQSLFFAESQFSVPPEIGDKRQAILPTASQGQGAASHALDRAGLGSPPLGQLGRVGAEPLSTLHPEASGASKDERAEASVLPKVKVAVIDRETHLPPVAALSPVQQVAARIVIEAGAATESPGEAGAVLTQGPGSAVKVLHLRLEPENLGVVTIRMRLSGGRLDLQLEAARPETMRAIGKDKDLLVEKLRSSGYAMEALVIKALDPLAASIPSGPGAAHSGDASASQASDQSAWSAGAQNGESDAHDRQPTPRRREPSQPGAASDASDGAGAAGAALYI
jgi:hypothetical protein